MIMIKKLSSLINLSEINLLILANSFANDGFIELAITIHIISYKFSMELRSKDLDGH